MQKYQLMTDDSEVRVSRAKSISLFVAAPVDNKMGLPKDEIERSITFRRSADAILCLFIRIKFS